MVGLYIFGGLTVVGMAALIVFKTRSSRAAKVLASGWAEEIENESIRR
jgi:hypothetical protein